MRVLRRALAVLLATLLATVGIASTESRSAGASEADNAQLDVHTTGAPVDPTGRTPGARTDFIVGFADSDPAVPGIGMREGGTIRVTLPPDFKNTMNMPVVGIGGRPGCAPPLVLGCSTGVVVQGWPQSPVPPLPSVSHDATTNTFIFTMTADWPAGGREAPGPKAVHLITLGFRNPTAVGDYPVHVNIKPDPSSTRTLSGTGSVRIDHTTPVIAANSQAAAPGPPPWPNTLVQSVPAGETTSKMAFYLTDRSAKPILGATIAMSDPTSGEIRSADGNRIGDVAINAPTGASGFSLEFDGPSEEAPAFVTGTRVGRLTGQFRTAARATGDYVLTFQLDGGDPLVHRVTAVSPFPGSETAGGRTVGSFVRLPSDTSDPSGSSVATDCGATAFDNARTSLRITTRNNASTVQILMSDARPNTLYTVWLRLKGTTVEGVSFGGSPLTGAGSTPLAPTTKLGELLEATGDGNGTRMVANGLRTNNQGNGQLHVTLDFPVVGGAYPFDRFDEFDPTDARFALDEPAAVPTAIVFPSATVDAPFGLRIVSHCTDDLGHGFDAGVRQPWFDWPR